MIFSKNADERLFFPTVFGLMIAVVCFLGIKITRSPVGPGEPGYDLMVMMLVSGLVVGWSSFLAMAVAQVYDGVVIRLRIMISAAAFHIFMFGCLLWSVREAYGTIKVQLLFGEDETLLFYHVLLLSVPTLLLALVAFTSATLDFIRAFRYNLAMR